MRTRRLLLLLYVLLVSPLTLAQAQPPFLVTAMGSYQEESVVQQRLGADGAQALADYLDAVVRALGSYVSAVPRSEGANLAVVIAIRPERRSRAWLVHQPGAIAPAFAAELVQRVLSVPPIAVADGPVAIYIVADLWGGGPPVISENDPLPVPIEWLDALRRAGGGRLPETALEALWP